MDLRRSLEKISAIIKKYRYAVLVLVIGLVLMVIPSAKPNGEETGKVSITQITPEPTLEEMLSSILSQVDGAGQVRVVLSISTGEEIIYQTNDDITSSDNTNSTNVQTVTVTDANRNQSGLVRQVNPAVYQGAIVVCQGADDPSVRLAMVDAISRLTGLGANRISVLKMK